MLLEILNGTFRGYLWVGSSAARIALIALTVQMAF